MPTDEQTLALYKIAESIDKVGSLINKENPILIVVISAFIAAFAAYIFNLFHWKTVQKQKKIITISEKLQSEISKLEACSIKYWLTNFTLENKIEMQSLAIEITSLHLSVNKYIGLFGKCLDKKDDFKLISELTDFGRNIFDLVTSGTFKSKQHTSSKTQASNISRECSTAKSKISQKIFTL